MVEAATPDVATTVLDVEPSAPAVEHSEPVVEHVAPVVEHTEPVVEHIASVVEQSTPEVEADEPDVVEETAEERLEHDEAEEARVANRGLNPLWKMKRHDDEVSRREVRAAADPESDTAETLFIQSEREAEEHGGD
jgi:hypothetical protein